MKKIILLLSLAVSVSACRTPEQAAQRHLKRAIKLDPGIVSRMITDTTVKGVAAAVIRVETPGSSGEANFNCDSLKKELDKARAKDPLGKGEVLVHSDSNVNISVKSGPNGQPQIKYVVKPKYINVPVKFPYEVKVKVPGKTVTLEVDKPAYKYVWFWILSSFSVLALFLLLKGSKPVLYIQEKIKGAK